VLAPNRAVLQLSRVASPRCPCPAQDLAPEAVALAVLGDHGSLGCGLDPHLPLMLDQPVRVELVIVGVQRSLAADVLVKVGAVKDWVGVDARTEDTEASRNCRQAAVDGITSALLVVATGQVGHAEEVVESFFPRPVVVTPSFDERHDGAHLWLFERSHHERQEQ
jgi:hypothetical protein